MEGGGEDGNGRAPCPRGSGAEEAPYQPRLPDAGLAARDYRAATPLERRSPARMQEGQFGFAPDEPGHAAGRERRPAATGLLADHAKGANRCEEAPQRAEAEIL